MKRKSTRKRMGKSKSKQGKQIIKVVDIIK